MIALDTNLLARLLLRDDTAQHAKVVALLGSGQVFTAPATVMLELVWVLEAHGCTPGEIERGLMLLLGLANFKPPQAGAIKAALGAYAKGMDFADALHLALSTGAESLATFDKAFVRKAAALKLTPKVTAA